MWLWVMDRSVWRSWRRASVAPSRQHRNTEATYMEQTVMATIHQDVTLRIKGGQYEL